MEKGKNKLKLNLKLNPQTEAQVATNLTRTHLCHSKWHTPAAAVAVAAATHAAVIVVAVVVVVVVVAVAVAGARLMRIKLVNFRLIANTSGEQCK